MGMIDRHIEAERLQQHVLVEHQVLRLFGVAFPQRIRRLHPETDVHHLDDVLELAWLLFDLRGRGWEMPKHKTTHRETLFPFLIGRFLALPLLLGTGRPPLCCCDGTA